MPGDCHFQESWILEPEFEGWLRRGSSNSYAHCHYCMKEFSVKGRGITQIKQHAAGLGHAAKVKAQKKQINPLTSFFQPSGSSKTAIQTSSFPPKSNSNESNENSAVVAATLNSTPSNATTSLTVQSFILPPQSLRDNTTRAEILFALKMVSSHSSFNEADNLTKLVSVAFPDSEIAKNFKLNPSKAAYVITHGLGPYFIREINKILSSCNFFVAQFDEAFNAVSQKGQMDLHIRFVDSNGIVQTKYVNSAFLGRSTAEQLLIGLKDCFENDPSLLQKIEQLSMDGPNVNWKLLSLFKNELAEMPNNFKVIDIGSCGLHVVHGALKTGFQTSS